MTSESSQPAKGAAAEHDWTQPNTYAKVLRGLQLGRFSGLGIWALFIIIFTIWIPDLFLTSTTLKTILSAQAITAILAIAVVFPLAAGVFDLSAAQNLGTTALICGALMSRAPHFSPELAIAATLGVGLLIGLVNAILVAGIGVNSFIATLGTSSLIIALGQLVGNESYVGPFPESFTSITGFEVLGIPSVVLYLFALAVVAWYVLEHTPVGRRIYATGANMDAARLAGVTTRRYVVLSFLVCGVGAAVAGVLLASSINSVSETVGPSYLLPAYAAAFLGTTQLKPGRFNIWGTMLAIYMLGTGVEGLQLAGGEQWVTNVFNGVALISAVSVAIILERRRGRRALRRRQMQAAKAA